MNTRTITISKNSEIHTVITHSEPETYGYAQKLVSKFSGGDVLALTGDLGAGKTAFTKGIAKALGVKNTVTSPTFVIMKIYDVPAGHDTISQLCHVDAYRLTSGHDLEDIGIKDYMNDKHTITIIEWAEHIKDIIPPDAIWIHFEHSI
ncbi:MAG: tRNA (adenosine(37)-N6)-threonylcarbamoyltransferase complex ATPase subunit type 1 TsaE [bacterium]|nr:tRNA (adenosine(37)-N6)-threonylcarbamoyltransferase complex ATPase subunit type 1 TsaE [bacterium]